MDTAYIAGGCLWGVQAFMKIIPGVKETEAGRVNGTTSTLDGEYDGYAEAVKVTFDPNEVTVSQLMEYLFEIIDPYSVNQQGEDRGLKYRTGFYSESKAHLSEAQDFIDQFEDHHLIATEVLPLTNYIPSADEHQDYLDRHPNDYCHIPQYIFDKYKN